MKHTIDCPTCTKKIPILTDMYIESGDVCYDVFSSTEKAEEMVSNEYANLIAFKCTGCKAVFTVELDESHWGEANIPLIIASIDHQKKKNNNDKE